MDEAVLILGGEESVDELRAKEALGAIRDRLSRGEVAFVDAVELRRIARLELGTNGGQEVPLWISHALAGMLPYLTVR